MENLLRLEEVAHILKISHTQARSLVLYEEKIPHVTVGVRGIRVKEGDLKAYIASLEKKGGDTSGSQGNKAGGVKDTREPYGGSEVLSGNKGRDRPPDFK